MRDGLHASIYGKAGNKPDEDASMRRYDHDIDGRTAQL